MGLYLRPTELAVALAALAERPFTVLAGGTDVFPARVGKPLAGDILDIGKIGDLRGVSECGDHFRFGATTTWSDLLAAPLPAWFDGAKSAAREVGGALGLELIAGARSVASGVYVVAPFRSPLNVVELLPGKGAQAPGETACVPARSRSWRTIEGGTP